MLHYAFIFFYNDTSSIDISTLSLHDALPISKILHGKIPDWYYKDSEYEEFFHQDSSNSRITNRTIEQILKKYKAKTVLDLDRKSTRLNSSHMSISYAVFCLKKKKKYYYINSK